MGMEDLQSNPKLWTPTQLSVYLITALRVRSGNRNAETASLPMPVAKDIAAWVKATRITGRVFLRWEEEDLEGCVVLFCPQSSITYTHHCYHIFYPYRRLGLNLLWRNALLNASRNLRQNVLKGRIWGPPSPLPSPTASPSPSPVTRHHNGDLSVSTGIVDDEEEAEGDGSGRFNFSSTLYSSASSTSSLDLPGTLSEDNININIPDLTFGASADSSLRRGGRVSRSKFKGRPSAGIGEKDGRVKGMVDKWEVKSNGSVSGSENENENERDGLDGGWVATRRRSTRRTLGREREMDGAESGASASESEGEGEGEVDVEGGSKNDWNAGAIVAQGFDDDDEVNGGGLYVRHDQARARAQDGPPALPNGDDVDDDDLFDGHRHVVSISHSTLKPSTSQAPTVITAMVKQGEEEPSIEDLLASETQPSPTNPNLASSARSWGARAWEDMEIGETVKRVSSASPEKGPLSVQGLDGDLQEEDGGRGIDWVTMRKVAAPSIGRAGGADFDFDLGSVRGIGKGSMRKKMKIGKGTGSIRLKDKGERKGIDGLFDAGVPPVDTPFEADEEVTQSVVDEAAGPSGPELEEPSASASEPAPELITALDEMERVMQIQVQSSKELLDVFRARLEEVERRVKDMEVREEVWEKDLEVEREAAARLAKDREAEMLALGVKMKEDAEKVEAMRKDLEETRRALALADSRAASSPPTMTESTSADSTIAPSDNEPLSVDGLNINPSAALAKLVPGFVRTSNERHSGTDTEDGPRSSPHDISELPSYVVLAGLGVCVVVLQVVFKRVLTGRRS